LAVVPQDFILWPIIQRGKGLNSPHDVLELLPVDLSSMGREDEFAIGHGFEVNPNKLGEFPAFGLCQSEQFSLRLRLKFDSCVTSFCLHKRMLAIAQIRCQASGCGLG